MLESGADAALLERAFELGQQGYERILTFQRNGDTIMDDQTGSTWNVLGQATAGELAGKQLTPVVHADHFWFSWAAFRPDTVIYAQ